MSRGIKEDFERLKDFLKSYSLFVTFEDKYFVELLSIQHKRYFALLTIVAEMKHQEINPIPKSVQDYAALNKFFLDYIAETVSDLGSALFVWIHGAYKVARLSLRSAIENFLKAIGIIEYPNIINTKNTYEVIDIAGRLKIFNGNNNKLMFDDLNNIYSILCATVHTATIQQMEHISAIGYFPHFDPNTAKEYEEIFFKVSQIFTSILCLMFKDCYLCMHYTNRDIVVNILDPAIIKTLQGA